MPIVIVNIDGIIGYFDEQKNYFIRSGVLN